MQTGSLNKQINKFDDINKRSVHKSGFILVMMYYYNFNN